MLVASDTSSGNVPRSCYFAASEYKTLSNFYRRKQGLLDAFGEKHVVTIGYENTGWK